MGGSLRFKVGRNHKFMEEAINKLNISIANAKNHNLFNFKEGPMLLKQLENHIPNYAYIDYKVKNEIFNRNYKQKKVKDKLISYSKITDPNSQLKKYFTVLREEEKRKYNNEIEVGSSRNINERYPSYLGYKGSINNKWSRHTDCETMLLEELSSRFREETQAEVHLFTYLEPCLSCDLTIIKFLKDFPNIDLYIYFFEEKKNCELMG
ncbi:deaminase domain-containing protein [Bacillus mycoides]|uniref:deaminase domain-containing protein n=1 Tax=Bacillus mycoides TaxID=1405 RepID=UPI003F756404